MHLNPQQQAAVDHLGSPLLVLAGAGSGKTRVLACRARQLLENRIALPHEVMAVTFTNKAAGELKERLADCGGGMWVGTFHSICARILRGDIELLGYGKNFVIFDDGEQAAVLKGAIERLGLDEKAYLPKAVLSQISRLKSQGVSPEEFSNEAKNYQAQNIARLYSFYQDSLKKQNALDFDDLLLLAVELLEKHPEVLDRYRRRIKHLLVDEYQDTNLTQYRLIRLLGNENLFVVGDVDQSIYSFRAADFRIILQFQQDFPAARVIKLEENYRSTKTILDAANAVIEKNTQRYPKELFTSKPLGEPISLFRAADERGEANWVVEQISNLRRDHSLSDFAVLYRTNAQSRALEEGFLRHGLAYRLVGGFRFYQRKEVKDIVGYLRLVFNPKDDAAFCRVVNVPKRGIGQTTVERILEAAGIKNLSALEAISTVELGVGARQTRVLENFSALIQRLSGMESISELLEGILEESGYQTELEADRTPEGISRLENVKELLSVARDFERGSDDPSLEAFLMQMALLSDLDALKGEEAVTLMTLHSAKGLEFPVVFLCGMEEGLFPHKRTFDHPDEMEEERRICYVGITRARERLFLSHAKRRMMFGQENPAFPSRFLEEFPHLKGEEAEKKERPRPLRAESVQWTQDFGQSQQGATKNSKKPVFAEGDRVVHPSFGHGVVARLIGEGDRTCVAVAFPGLGQKILDLRYAPLSPAENGEGI
ncbi:MAG TPA: UvrD-helicase domain-containing protein [Chroococcales cyanobacterium]|jgi:DNA helicase-2/ATP-dependent DNA helicase PcrA